MRLMNVRLSEDDYAKVRALRDDGVSLSDLIRTAIRERHAQLSRSPRTAEDVDRIMKSLFERFPDPPDYKPPEVNPHDRRDVQRYIREKLTRKIKRNCH